MKEIWQYMKEYVKNTKEYVKNMKEYDEYVNILDLALPHLYGPWDLEKFRNLPLYGPWDLRKFHAGASS